MGLLWYPLSFLGAFQHWNLQWWAEFFHRIHDLWQYLHHRQQQHQINVRRFQRGIFLNKEPSCAEATLKVSQHSIVGEICQNHFVFYIFTKRPHCLNAILWIAVSQADRTIKSEIDSFVWNVGLSFPPIASIYSVHFAIQAPILSNNLTVPEASVFPVPTCFLRFSINVLE